MPVVPVRNLSDKGILHDPSAFDVSIDAYTNGLNFRFDGNNASRAPVWRSAYEGLTATPQFCMGYRPSSGFDAVFVQSTTGQITKYSSGTLTDVTPGGFTPTTLTTQPTGTFLGDVAYINNPSGQPLYWAPTSTLFAPMSSWPANTSCVSMRAYKSYLVAVNVTKAGVQTPSMVKTSNLVLAGLPPDSWDQTDPTKSATENVLQDLTSPLLDCLPLRDMNVLYSGDQIWQMQADGSQAIFQYYRLFSEGGIIAPNCVVEVQGRHFVFGTNDIYWHDGVQKQSIVDLKNRKWIFRTMNTLQASRCFVSYNPRLQEITFAYVSSDANATFTGPTGCNMGFVYNLVAGTHSFIDLPNVTSMGLANLNAALQWNTAPAALTWATMGGSWYDQVDGYDQHVCAVSQSLGTTLTAHRLLAYDYIDNGSLAFPLSSEATAPAFIEHTGIDLDELQAGLASYKKINRIWPLANTYKPDARILISAGASMTSQPPPVYGGAQSYNPTTDYKIDVRLGGRFLAYKVQVNEIADVDISGFDADVINGGLR